MYFHERPLGPTSRQHLFVLPTTVLLSQGKRVQPAFRPFCLCCPSEARGVVRSGVTWQHDRRRHRITKMFGKPRQNCFAGRLAELMRNLMKSNFFAERIHVAPLHTHFMFHSKLTHFRDGAHRAMNCTPESFVVSAHCAYGHKEFLPSAHCFGQ